MNTTEIGRKAEERVAAYLRQHGYRILSQNWRTRYCEIDIVALKERTIYFVEVKYRSHGCGLDYVTATKLRQMRFAAQLWIATKNWQGDYELAAIEVDQANLELVII